jgi:hypothetical protein
MLAHRLGYEIREIPVHWRAVRGSHVRIVVDSAQMAFQVARLSRRSHNQTLAALEAHGRSPGVTPEQVREALRRHLPVAGPMVPSDKGVLVILPMVEPVDAAELAHALERSLEDVLVRPASIHSRELLAPADPAAIRRRGALTSW